MLRAIRHGVRRIVRLAISRDDITADDVDAELAFYIEARTAQLTARGMTAEDARAEAVRRLGDSIDRTRAQLTRSAIHRDRKHRLLERFDGIRQDVQFGARSLLRDWRASAFIVLTLALGLGAGAAVFGVVDRLLVQRLGYVDQPDRVVRVVSPPITVPGYPPFIIRVSPYVLYDALSSADAPFSEVAAHVGPVPQQLGRGTDARSVSVAGVSGSYFSLLGAQPVLGRFFSEQESRPNTYRPVVVLGYGLWKNAFGGDKDAIGKPIVLNATTYTIIGVAPRGFTVDTRLGRTDAVVPIPFILETFLPLEWPTTWAYGGWLGIVGRLQPGVTPERAGLDIAATHRRAYDGPYSAAMANPKYAVRPMAADQEELFTQMSVLSAAIAGLLLLIAAANVINLLLARSVRRHREVAVRLALGAGRARLFRLLLTESVMLAGAGGIAGLVVAYPVARLLRGMLFADVEFSTPPVDFAVVAAAVALAIGVGILVGVAPAIRAGRTDLTPALKTGALAGGTRGSRLRDGLTVAQAALSVILVVAAGLFAHSLWRMRSLDLGVEPSRVLRVFLPATPDATGEQQRAVARQVVEQIRHLPGVEHASLVRGPSLGTTIGLSSNVNIAASYRVEGSDTLSTAAQRLTHVISPVGPDYFATVGARLLRGRGLTDDDRSGSEPVLIVSETMARLLWPEREALGQCLGVYSQANPNPPCARVVGVVADVRSSLRQGPTLHLYEPLDRDPAFGTGVGMLVRPVGSASAFIPTLRKALTSLYPQDSLASSFANIESLQAQFEPTLRPLRAGATILGVSAALGIFVAAAGLYAVIAFAVAQRRREIGIRIALGARGSDVLSLVMRHGVGMAALGVALGAVAAVAGGRALQPVLFQTSSGEPIVLVAAVALLTAAAFIASLVPAAGARRIDPVVVLRDE